MPQKKSEQKKLEDHEPGATREEVIGAIKKVAKSVQDVEPKQPEK